MHRHAVSRARRRAVDLDRSPNDLDPALAAGFQTARDGFAACEQRIVKFDVLANEDRAVAAVGRADEPQPSAPFGLREGLLIVTRRKPLPVGQHPDLQEVHRVGFRVIELAVTDTGAGRHHLHVARADHRAYVGNDFHVSVPCAGPDAILVAMSFGTLYLGRAIAHFMERYPQLQNQLVLSDQQIDPVQEGFDVTLRIADLPSSSLIARRIAPAARVVCAAPSYLERRGTPKRPNDLRSHECLAYGHLATGNQWKLTGSDGEHWIHIPWTAPTMPRCCATPR